MRIVLVGLGGCIGAVTRYLFGGAVQLLSRSISFPFGTVAVNLVGCFVIGALSHLAESRGAFTVELRAFLIIGVLGGFTTFSAFANETFNLLRDTETWLASVNVLVQVAGGLACVWMGRALAHFIWG